jgi:hypothetical protein
MSGSKVFGRTSVLLVLVLSLLLHARNAAAATTPEQVREFVRAVYIEGVPYEQASQLAPEVALPILEQVLRDPADEQYWANAAVTIGMIGHDQGVELLIRFITRGEARAKLSRDQTLAKTSAVMALGYIVNKAGNRKALDFLKTSIDPQGWSKRNLKWTGEFHRTNLERDKQLATMSVLGLGVSGNPDAARTLQSLREKPKTRNLRALKKTMPDLSIIADEALKANDAISREGLQNYYIKTQPKLSPIEGGINIRSTPEIEVVKAPVAGEVIKEPQPGEVLRNPQLGEVLSPPKAGEVVRPLQKGETLKPN